MKILKFNENIIDNDFRLGDLNNYKKLTRNQFIDVINNFFNISDIIKEYLITYKEKYSDTEITFENHQSYTIESMQIQLGSLILQVKDYTDENSEIVIGLNRFWKFYNNYDIFLKTKKYNL